MSDDRLDAILGQEEQALKIALARAMKAMNEAPTTANLRAYQTARKALDQFLAEAAEASDTADHFGSITAAFAWYKAEGGDLEQTQFYKVVPRLGKKKVSRFAVSEMLRKQRATSPAAAHYGERKEAADLRKAEAEARIKERQDERERRELDAEWIRREQADEITCVWVSRHRDAVAYHLGKNLLALIHGCGGNPARLAEVQAIVDAALAAAANEIAESDEITVEIEDVEEI